MSRVWFWCPFLWFVAVSVLSADDAPQKSESERWVEVFPVEVAGGAQTTSSAGGKEYPTTGVGAASWFNWSGIGNWKVFIVQPESELLIHISGDS